jgi:rhomboid family GlyGly-CTERM serine protease
VNRNGVVTMPFRSLTLAAIALVTATPAAAPIVGQFLVLNRADVLSGEIWRLFTGHLVHAGREHMLWDVLSLIGIGFVFEEYLGRRFWQALAIAALVVGAGLVILDPGLPDYRGLSGVLNGLWVTGALLGIRAEAAAGRRPVAWMCAATLVLALAKIVVEARFGPLFTDPARLGAPTVLLSHALGFAGGVIAYRWCRGDALASPGGSGHPLQRASERVDFVSAASLSPPGGH